MEQFYTQLWTLLGTLLLMAGAYIKSKYEEWKLTKSEKTQQMLDMLVEFVPKAVRAVEQIAPQLKEQGIAKKDEAMERIQEFCSLHNIPLDDVVVDTLIESFVKGLTESNKEIKLGSTQDNNASVINHD